MGNTTSSQKTKSIRVENDKQIEQGQQWLTTNGFNSVTDLDDQNSPVLHYAIGIFAPDPVLIYIIQKSRELFRLEDRIHYVDPIQMKDQNGIAAIHVASVYGNISALKLLLDHTKCTNQTTNIVNVLTNDSINAVLMACEKNYQNHLQVVQILHQNGAHVTGHVNEFGDFPLWTASYHGNIEIVSWLLTAIENGGGGAVEDISTRTARGDTAFSAAVQNGKLETCQLLLKHGAEIRTTNESGIMPMWLACQFGDMNLVQFLVSNGAGDDLLKITPDESTCLSIACHNGHLKIAQFCYQYDEECKKHLYIKSQAPTISSLQLIGANILIDPIVGACQNGCHETLRWLLSIYSFQGNMKGNMRAAMDTICTFAPNNSVACANIILNESSGLFSKDNITFFNFSKDTKLSLLECLLQGYTNGGVVNPSDPDRTNRSQMLCYLIKKGCADPNDTTDVLFRVPKQDSARLVSFAQDQIHRVKEYLQFLLCMRHGKTKNYEKIDRFAFQHVRHAVRSYLIDADVIQHGTVVTLQNVLTYQRLFSNGNIVVSKRDIFGPPKSTSNQTITNISLQRTESYAILKKRNARNPLKSWLQTDVLGRLNQLFEHPENQSNLNKLIKDIPTLPLVFETVCSQYRMSDNFTESGILPNWFSYLYDIYIDDEELHNAMIQSMAETFVNQIFKHGDGEEGMWTMDYLKNKRGYRIAVLE